MGGLGRETEREQSSHWLGLDATVIWLPDPALCHESQPAQEPLPDLGSATSLRLHHRSATRRSAQTHRQLQCGSQACEDSQAGSRQNSQAGPD